VDLEVEIVEDRLPAADDVEPLDVDGRRSRHRKTPGMGWSPGNHRKEPS
jgi:hypothetical protein